MSKTTNKTTTSSLPAFDETVDVLVVGTGAAGCAAGAAAARIPNVRKVLICEASPKMVGGTTKLAGGGWLWVPNNPWLEKLGVKQPEEEIFELLKELAYPRAEGVKPAPEDLRLMKTFAYEWPSVIREILAAGVMKLQQVDTREPEDTERMRQLLRRKMRENPDLAKTVGINEKNFEKLASLMPSYCAEHDLDKCPTGKVLSPDGSTTSLQLEKACKTQKNCEIRMNARVVDIIFSSQGEVIGAVVKSGDNKSTRVRALGGVIFGSGGFAQNRKLLNEVYGGEKNAPLGSCAAKTNVGDLIDIARRHDIPVSGLNTAWLKQTVMPYSFPKRLGVFFLNGDSYMVVDRTGNRFASDRDFYQQRGLQMLGREDRRFVFFVFDERVWKYCEGPIKGLGSAYPMQDEANEDAVIRGSNVAELAKNIKSKLAEIDKNFTLVPDFGKALEAQIARFNAMAKTGKDTEFGRGDNSAQYCWSVPRAKDNKLPNKTMYPLDTTQLRCVILGLSLLDTKGGPVIDENGRILGKNGKPITGLYGCGNAVRSSTRNSYPASGVTLSNAILFGWKAGKHAAAKAAAASAKL